jgi:tetratricopeptide (TPR) repeat protein
VDDSGQETIADTRIGARPRSPAPVLERGTTIGRYHVLAQLGRGAMGVVYEAYDPELDRKVALKVLRFAERTDGSASEREARLLREAQALAQLSHPNVVGVHDVGRVTGQIFIAMELVAGQTLSAWLRASPRPWPAVLEIFIAMGRGLAAAHAAGLVHRDVKPDNVMIGDDARVRVMDFGLALVGDPSASMQAPIAVGWNPSESMASSVSLTRDGAFAGTPAYMSPEQHRRGDVDARSDQFSFCVALYEALYGVRPFRGETAAAVAIAACEDDPQPRPPATPVPARIHAVLLRGLEKDPKARWATMEALVVQLSRDPKRRRRAWMAVSAVAIAALSGWGAIEVQAHRAAAACEAAGHPIRDVWSEAAAERVWASLKATEVPHAAVAWTRAEPRLDAYADAWHAMRTDVCRRTSLDREWSADQRARAEECLDERKARLVALLDVLAQADREVVFRVVDAVAGLPELGPCVDPSALARRTPVSDDPAERERLASLRDRLENARALKSSGRYDAAREIAEGMLADARDARAERLELEALIVLGRVEQALDARARAQEHLEAAYFGAERLGLPEIAAQAALSLASVVGGQGAQPEDGLQWARHAEGALHRLETTHDLAWADLLSTRAELESDRSHHDEAIADHRAALEIRRAVLGEDHPAIAESLAGLSSAYFAKGSRVEAFGYLEQVLAIRERAFGDDHPAVAEVLNNLGVARISGGELDAAEEALGRALEIRRQALGPDHSRVANTLTALGDLAFARGELRDAVAYNRQALAIREKVWSADHPMLAQSLNNLGAALDDLGEYEEATVVFRRAVEIAEASLGPRHFNTLLVRWGLGKAEIGRGERARGIRTLDEALRAFGDGRPPSDPDVAAHEADYAQSLWPTASSTERSALRERAQRARAVLRDAGPDHAADLARVEAWLTAHEG